MPFLYGPRVYLRAVEVEDWAKGYGWINDPEVSRFLVGGVEPYSKLREREWYKAAAEGSSDTDIHFAVVTREDDRYIGNAGLHRINWRCRRAALGIMIGEKDCWNQGYGTEATRLILEFAFGELGLHRVWLDVDSDNRRARRAYEKAGFKQEGIKRDHMYYDGAFHDIVLMSILSSDTLPEGAVADES